MVVLCWNVPRSTEIKRQCCSSFRSGDTGPFKRRPPKHPPQDAQFNSPATLPAPKTWWQSAHTQPYRSPSGDIRNTLPVQTLYLAPHLLYLKQHGSARLHAAPPRTLQTAGKLSFCKTIWKSGWPYRRQDLGPRKAKGSVKRPCESRPRTSHARYSVSRTWWGPDDGTEGGDHVWGLEKREPRVQVWAEGARGTHSTQSFTFRLHLHKRNERRSLE